MVVEPTARDVIDEVMFGVNVPIVTVIWDPGAVNGDAADDEDFRREEADSYSLLDTWANPLAGEDEGVRRVDRHIGFRRAVESVVSFF